MTHKFWTFRNAAHEANTGELLLYGLIGSDSGMGWLFDDVSPKQFKNELDALGDISELRVMINSEGGDVFAGQAIHSILKRHSAHVTVMVDGLAASIASVIAMAGDTVLMPRNAMMMVHNPITVTFGDAEEHRKQAETLDQVRESIIAAYEGKTGMDRDELLPLLDAETWLTADDAVRMGFADEIEEAKEIAASLITPDVMIINGLPVNLARFENPPTVIEKGFAASYQNTYGEQAETVLGSLDSFAQRTIVRAQARQHAGRNPSEMDKGHWGKIQDTASRVLSKFGDSEGSSSDELQSVYAEFLHITSR